MTGALIGLGLALLTGGAVIFVTWRWADRDERAYHERFSNHWPDMHNYETCESCKKQR